MQPASFIYLLLVTVAVVFSYFFVDQNFPLYNSVKDLVETDKTLKTMLYLACVMGWFSFYAYALYLISKKSVFRIWVFVLINILLLVSYPAFSFDIFNYIATAKVTFLYGENPYIVMPIELSNEPLLSFMHAANKTALYGLSWIVLSAFPFFAGLNNLFLTIFTFKLFNFLFYVGTCYLLLALSKQNKFKLALFALNPLVVIETLISAHNDIVMMFFALLSFYLLRKKLYIFSICAIVVSIFIKFATVLLLPIFIYVFFLSIKHQKVNWDKIWFYSFLLLLVAFLLSPIREEMYSWYFIWPFTFLVLTEGRRAIKFLAVFLSFGLLLRFTPFIYTGVWGGITPLVKMFVTISSLIVGLISYPFFKRNYL